MYRRMVVIILAAALTMSPNGVAARQAAESEAPASVPGEKCPDELHDSITVTGPDGKPYPTWHPPVHESGCYFGHEHGADPQASNANNTLPPFGHIGALIGDNEPHEGFKVFVTNRGYTSEGGTAQADSRIVFHMGTAGTGRYTTRLHSMMFDWRHPDGRRLSLQGLADTGAAVGSTCDRPRKGGRDFSTVGCDDAYEIWSARFQVIHPDDPYIGVDQTRGSVSASVAAFDPILTRVPGDDRRVLYTETYRDGPMASNPTSPLAKYRGCAREAYDGPVYFNNDSSRPGASTVYWTDVYGRVDPAGERPDLLRQDVTDTPRSSFGQFKYRRDFCDPTVRAPN